MLVLDTISDLVATTPVPGQAAFVRGYHSVDDGGGGWFGYTNNGETTDGATVFAHTPDIGAEQSDAGISRNALNGFALGADVAWGTVTIDLAAPASVTLRDVHLHGHATDNNTINPLTEGYGRLDYGTGLFTDRANWIRDTMSNVAATTLTIKRKHITNTRRWIRLPEDKNVFHYAWIGSLADTDSGFLLSWALNHAKRLGFNTLDMDGIEATQSGIIEILSDMTVRRGKIKTRGDDWAVKVLRETPPYTFDDPEYYVNQMIPWLGVWNSSVSGVEITLENLDLDGNIAGNQDALLNPGNYPQLENQLQNSVHWSGFSWHGQNNRQVSPRSFCRIVDCHFHDFGSNCTTAHPNILFSTNRLRLGNSARNHLWYSLNGVHVDMYMYGYAWATYSKSEGCRIEGCTVENLAANPYFFPSGITIWHYEGDDWGDGSLREPSRFDRRPGAIFTDVTVTLDDDTQRGPLFGVLGQGAHFQNMTVVTGTNASCQLFAEVSNVPTGLNRNVTVENVTVIVRCGPDEAATMMDDMFADHLSMRDVTFFVRRGFTPPSKVSERQGEFLVLQIPDTSIRTDPSFLFTRTAELRNFSYASEYGTAPVRLKDILSSNTDPVRFIVENGLVRTTFAVFTTTGTSGSGDTDDWTINDPSKFEGYWRNVHFDVENFDAKNLRAFLFTAKGLENITAQWTTVVTQRLFSEEVIEVDQDFTGLTQIDIPTDLFWVPKRIGSIDLVAKNAAAATALDGSFVSFRDRGNTQDIEWDDLIAGSPDYRAPILRITTAAPIAAGNLEMEISLRVV